MKKTFLVTAWLFLSAGSVIAQVGPGPIPGVQGPASATNGHIAVFNGTTGKIISDGGAPSGSGTVTSVTCGTGLTGGTFTTTGTCAADFGTASSKVAQGGVISAGGPTGSATVVPVITYNAAGQLTSVTTAATGVTTVGTAAAGQIPGTTTNDDASSGNVGQYLSATGTSVSLVTNTAKTCSSINLTSGDWDVTGVLEIFGASGTVQTSANSSLSTTDNTLDISKDRIIYTNGVSQTTPDNSYSLAGVRFTVASTTPVYLVGKATFTVSTMAMTCSIHARRVR